MTLQEALHDIKGWLGDGEAQLLHDLAATIRLPQMILEVGSYQGRSTIALALDAQTPVFAVDPHDVSVGDSFPFGDEDRAALMANLVKAGVAWKVRLLDIQSAFAARCFPHSIGLLFIDGAHSYEGVKADIEAWLPHVVEGGYVAFHDSNAPQIQQAITECKGLDLMVAADVTQVYRKVTPPEPEPTLKAEIEPEMVIEYGLPLVEDEATPPSERPVDRPAPGDTSHQDFTEADKPLRTRKPTSKAKAKGRRR